MMKPAAVVLSFRRAVLVLALLALALPAGVFAAEGLPTANELGNLKTRAESDKTLAKDARDAVVQACDQAVAELQRLTTLKEEAATYDGRIKSDPAETSRVLKQLEDRQSQPLPTISLPRNATLAQLEGELKAAQAKQAALLHDTQGLDTALANLAAQRLEYPKLRERLQAELSDVEKKLSETAAEGQEPAILKNAQRALQQVKQAVLRQNIDTANKQNALSDVHEELLKAQRGLKAREQARADETVKLWQQAATRARGREAQSQLEEARAAAAADSGAPAAIRALRSENVDLSQQREKTTESVNQLAAQLDRVKARLDEQRNTFADIQDKVKVAGLTNAIGVLLRKQSGDLPDISQLRREVRARQQTLSEVQLELFTLSDRLDECTSRLQALGAGGAATHGTGASPEKLQQVLTTQQQYIQRLISLYNKDLRTLVDLDLAQRLLIRQSDEFAAYIDKRILWIRSAPTLSVGDVPRVADAVFWLLRPENLLSASQALLNDFIESPAWPSIAVMLFLAAMLLRRRMRRRLEALGERAESLRTGTYSQPLEVLLWSVLMGAALPAFLVFVGWRMTLPLHASVYAKAVGAGLRGAGWIFLVAAVWYVLCARRGLYQASFNWKPEALTPLRRALAAVMVFGLPTAFLFLVLQEQPNNALSSSLGRLMLIAGQLLLALVGARALRPRGALVEHILDGEADHWLFRFRFLWYPALLAVPLALALLTALGYDYTAVQLTRRVLTTVLLVLVLSLVYELLMRWLHIARHRMAVQRLRERRAEAAEEQAARRKGRRKRAASADELAAVPAAVEAETSVKALSRQTRHIAATVVVFAFFVGLWFIWSEVLPALAMLDSVTLWHISVPTEGGAELVRITLGDLALALLVIAVTVIAARNLPGLLEIAVLRRLPFDAGVRFAVATISRYLIIAIGVIIAFDNIGLGWSQVKWLAAAMSLGLGFGLQEIFANFVSGLIILFERPMRVGDIVTVGDITGWVTKIRIRATTITDMDRRELVVPNKEFITGRLINWSLSDTILRVIINVGIEYGSDTKRAIEVLHEVARNNKTVLDEPEPQVLFLGFGNSSLDFELRVFVPDYEHYWSARHELHYEIDQAFRKAGIVIAFPQQDLHIKSIDPVLPYLKRRGASRSRRPSAEKEE